MKVHQKATGIKSGRDVVQKSNIAANQILHDVDAAGSVEQIIDIVDKNRDKITEQLQIVKEFIEKQAREDTIAIENAIREAQSGSKNSVTSIIGKLSHNIGEIAQKVGATVVAKLIEKQIGL